MPATKYNFGELEIGDWFFLPHTTKPDHIRFQQAAHTYACRHNIRLRVRRGNRQGLPGSWCQRVEREEPSPIVRATPQTGEVYSASKLKYPLDEIHYHGSGWVPMPYEPGSEAMRAEVESFHRAVARYQRRNGIRFTIASKVRPVDGFGFLVTVDGRQETV